MERLEPTEPDDPNFSPLSPNMHGRLGVGEFHPAAGVRKGTCGEERAGIGRLHRVKTGKMRKWNMGERRGVRAIHESPLQERIPIS
jgi:hypothetical protein